MRASVVSGHITYLTLYAETKLAVVVATPCPHRAVAEEHLHAPAHQSHVTCHLLAPHMAGTVITYQVVVAAGCNFDDMRGGFDVFADVDWRWRAAVGHKHGLEYIATAAAQ